MKKTAVEKLEISLLGIISFDSEELRAKYKDIIFKAKEMEKKQITNAFDNGLYSWDNTDDFIGIDYYNKKFKNK
jgi:hypothetical protein